MIVVMAMAVRMGVTMFQARAMVVAMRMDVGVEMIMVMIVAVIMIGVMRVIHLRGQFLTIDTGFTLAAAAHGTHLFNL